MNQVLKDLLDNNDSRFTIENVRKYIFTKNMILNDFKSHQDKQYFKNNAHNGWQDDSYGIISSINSAHPFICLNPKVAVISDKEEFDVEEFAKGFKDQYEALNEMSKLNIIEEDGIRYVHTDSDTIIFKMMFYNQPEIAKILSTIFEEYVLDDRKIPENGTARYLKYEPDFYFTSQGFEFSLDENVYTFKVNSKYVWNFLVRLEKHLTEELKGGNLFINIERFSNFNHMYQCLKEEGIPDRSAGQIDEGQLRQDILNIKYKIMETLQQGRNCVEMLLPAYDADQLAKSIDYVGILEDRLKKEFGVFDISFHITTNIPMINKQFMNGPCGGQFEYVADFMQERAVIMLIRIMPEKSSN